MPSPPARSAAALAPTPTAPVDGAIAPLDAVTFRWSAPPGAASFDLRVATAAAPDAPLADLEALPTTETTLADVLPAGELVWWVRRTGGAWSAPARFVAGTAADVAVAETAEADAAAETRAAARALRHQPQAPGAEPPEPEWPFADGPALEGAPPLDWSTVPGFDAPHRSEGAPARAEAPTVLGPLGGVVVDAVTVALRWSAVPGASAYEVELSPRAAFDRDVLALDAGGATELSLPGLVPALGHRLLWRVRARTADGTTAWSRYGRFYPASDEKAQAFSNAFDVARAAERRRADYTREVAEAELDRLPVWERTEPVVQNATFLALMVMVASGLVIGLVAFIAVLVKSGALG